MTFPSTESFDHVIYCCTDQVAQVKCVGPVNVSVQLVGRLAQSFEPVGSAGSAGLNQNGTGWFGSAGQGTQIGPSRSGSVRVGGVGWVRFCCAKPTCSGKLFSAHWFIHCWRSKFSEREPIYQANKFPLIQPFVIESFWKV